MLRCDGCDAQVKSEDIAFFQHLGHMMRYCGLCVEPYAEFLRAVSIAQQKAQRLLDLEEQEIRERCPLKLTPLDMPKLVTAKGEPVTLG